MTPRAIRRSTSCRTASTLARDIYCETASYCRRSKPRAASRKFQFGAASRALEDMMTMIVMLHAIVVELQSVHLPHIGDGLQRRDVLAAIVLPAAAFDRGPRSRSKLGKVRSGSPRRATSQFNFLSVAEGVAELCGPMATFTALESSSRNQVCGTQALGAGSARKI